MDAADLEKKVNELMKKIMRAYGAPKPPMKFVRQYNEANEAYRKARVSGDVDAISKAIDRLSELLDRQLGEK